jgi:hypothetical protein
MKVFVSSFQCFFAISVIALASGCSKQEHVEGDHDHDRDEPAAKAQATYGFKEDRGVFLATEAEKLLGIKTFEPVARTFQSGSKAVARIYALGKATVFIDSNTASGLTPGSSVVLELGADAMATGTLVRIEREFQQSLGQAEALIEFAPTKNLQVGASVPVTFASPETKAEFSVPDASVLQTGDGHFVFVANGRHFTRTRVKPGAHAAGWVEIADGLLSGDIVVTNNIQSLWCIELQATKAGAACCPVPTK